MNRRRFLGACTCAFLPVSSEGNAVPLGCVIANDAPVFDDPTLDLNEEVKERHEIFLLCAASITFVAWGIHKSNPADRAAYAEAYPGRSFREYQGHNIGSLLVNGRNEIVCYERNLASMLNDSTQHAEARAVQHGIKALNADRYREGNQTGGYSEMLQGYTVYTTLESCTQCSGIMDLANITRVVYLQDDCGQQKIGNVLFNLFKYQWPAGAPEPVRGHFVTEFSELASAFAQYAIDSNTRSITSFLSSLKACRLFERMHERFNAYLVKSFPNKWVYEQAREYAHTHL
ncbi:deaminase [Rhizobium leguminosarum]|uniref:deaminase n=1 Tax=Rhizobium leguminosarum TaxID=384 RepID=UPI001C8FB163|nr:deaminase [Rhizobium leguminosarum]MBY2986682.1 hypothetical protein [Rhizobium leguminosarum]